MILIAASNVILEDFDLKQNVESGRKVDALDSITKIKQIGVSNYKFNSGAMIYIRYTKLAIYHSNYGNHVQHLSYFKAALWIFYPTTKQSECVAGYCTPRGTLTVCI